MKRISILIFVVAAFFVMVGCNNNNAKAPKVERIPYTITQSETNERDCIAHLNNGVDVHLNSFDVEYDLKNSKDMTDTLTICINIELEMRRVADVLNREYKGYAIVPNSDYNKVKPFSTFKYDVEDILLYYKWELEVVSPQNMHYVMTFYGNIAKGYYEITNIIILQ